VKSLPKKSLPLKELPSKIPLVIGDKLQKQIYAACCNVNSVEWSGMLFYDTEGEFGEEGFAIVANEFYLLHIGTGGYTEYAAGQDPEFIKFLMANPHIMTMKKGHIHSHNNMGVFFSGTDDDELVENSESHNFYVSLIVNNRNDMLAKVAFRAMSKGVTSSTITFKGIDGKETIKKMDVPFDKEVVYYHKCEISNFHSISFLDPTFSDRIKFLKEKKEADAKIGAARQASMKNGSTSSGTYKPSSTQGHLDFGKYPIHDPYNPDKDIEDLYVVGGGKETRTDPRVYSMLIKLLHFDFLYEGGSVESIIKDLDERFYGLEQGMMSKTLRNQYLDDIEKQAVAYYVDSFPEDQHCTGFNHSMDKCTEIVEFYEDLYPEMVTDLVEAFNISIEL